LRENGISPRIHGNNKRTPNIKNRVSVDNEVAECLKTYIKNYAEYYGLPSPGSHINKDTIAIVYLPSDTTYRSVYRDYRRSLQEKNNDKIISYYAFRWHWKLLCPEVQFMSPRTDLCKKCQFFKDDIQMKLSDDLTAKDALLSQYSAHIEWAKEERNHYNSIKVEAKATAEKINYGMLIIFQGFYGIF
jgi:hypothetical protein